MNKQEIYQKILFEYEQTRNTNRHLLDERREEVYAAIPEYKEICDSISSLFIILSEDITPEYEIIGTVPSISIHTKIKQITFFILNPSLFI